MAMAISKIPLSLYGSPPVVPKSDTNSTLPFFLEPTNGMNLLSRRLFAFASSISSVVMISSAASAETPPSKSFLSGIANTKSWLQFYGDGFAIRVPPAFEDITEPEDYNAGLSLYGDKAKPKTFAARFASADGRNQHQLHLEAKQLLSHLRQFEEADFIVCQPCKQVSVLVTEPCDTDLKFSALSSAHLINLRSPS